LCGKRESISPKDNYRLLVDTYRIIRNADIAPGRNLPRGSCALTIGKAAKIVETVNTKTNVIAEIFVLFFSFFIFGFSFFIFLFG
jgi:hypothetical protein